jgi:hypothetical protein
VTQERSLAYNDGSYPPRTSVRLSRVLSPLRVSYSNTDIGVTSDW